MLTEKILTENQVDEIFKKVRVKFSHYYKFCFTYVAKVDGYDLHVSFGGSSDDIYRHEVRNNEELDFVCCAEWSEVYVTKDGKSVFSLWNY